MPLTSAQIIGIGEYLESDFDPSTLTVAQLLGVLGFHNVIYPTPYTKPKLVQVFNEQIKPKASKFKKERLKKENSIASDDGIMDGVTGQPLGKGPARRSSRRLSHAPPEIVDLEATRPDPPKRRRSSAQPTFGGTSRPNRAAQATLIEESEPEEEGQELPVRKVGRSKKTSEAAGSQARRVSQPDSGWEDNNIFQSGAESSSPLRPSPVRPKPARKSIGARKSRKSTSAPPQLLQSPIKQESPVRFPAQSQFKPELPATVERETQLISPRAKIPKPVFSLSSEEDELILRPEAKEEYTEYTIPIQEESEEEEQVSEPEQENQTLAVANRIAEGGRPVALRTERAPNWRFLLLLLISGVVLSFTTIFKLESAGIGYCDANSNTNEALERLRDRRIATDACNAENRTTLLLSPEEGGEPCPPPALPWMPLPDSCTPCPEHATCTERHVTCQDGFLLKSHPALSFLPGSPAASEISVTLGSSPLDALWKVISLATDGLPGLGSIGLPPRCVEDPKMKRNIDVLGKALEAKLKQEKGRRICEMNETAVIHDADGGEAKLFGWEENNLRDEMRKFFHVQGSNPDFDTTFTKAVQQLSDPQLISIGEDKDGNRYIAHKTPDFTWQCVAKIKARQAWVEWRPLIFGLLALMAAILNLRSYLARKQAETKRVAELVQIALSTLQNQELAYHTDPVSAPQPYLSSLQLRDLILQEEHSIPTRSRLWDRVEQIVEGNANVRANVQEVHGGDELRVWRWVGSSGTPVIKKRAQVLQYEHEEE